MTVGQESGQAKSDKTTQDFLSGNVLDIPVAIKCYSGHKSHPR